MIFSHQVFKRFCYEARVTVLTMEPQTDKARHGSGFPKLSNNKSSFIKSKSARFLIMNLRKEFPLQSNSDQVAFWQLSHFLSSF
uniref:Uncharacterized protein n=1 Tax=Arundo donax TaxID=35708 RepID=A0A0A9D7Q9_ARUDO